MLLTMEPSPFLQHICARTMEDNSMIVLQDEGHHEPLPADNGPESLANVWS